MARIRQGRLEWLVRRGQYWERRYARGGNSGPGSYGRLAEFKAEMLNRFVAEHEIRTVIEFGCGDGHQLRLVEYPAYVGLDISPTAVSLCRERFFGDPAKQFIVYEPARYEPRQTADLALSLDVIFHLVDEHLFETYMRHLFASADRFVGIYASDIDQLSPWPFFRQRRFTPWIEERAPGWELVVRIPNRYPWRGDPHAGSPSDFYFYARR